MGWKAVSLGIFVLLISLVNAEYITERTGNDIQIQITQDPDLKIIKQTGNEQFLDFNWNKITDQEYQIQICIKDYNKNKEKFKTAIKVSKIKTKDKPMTDNAIDLSKTQCQTINIDFNIGEIVKFGDESTEIILDEENVTLIIHPEHKECEGFKCHSEINLVNNGQTNITLKSDDITINMNQPYHLTTKKLVMRDQYDCETYFGKCEQVIGTIQDYEYGHDASESYDIIIEPGQTWQYDLYATLQEFGEFKYDVNIEYHGQNYSIDPYFESVDSNPSAKFFSPNGEGYQVGDTVNILAGVVSNESIDSFQYSIQYPNLSIQVYNVTILQNVIYHALIDDPDSSNTTDGLLYSFGDTSWGGNRFWSLANVIRGHQSGYIDGYDANIDLIFGNPQGMGFVYDIYICELGSDTFTNTNSLFTDCIDTPTLISDHINVSQYWDNTKSSVTGRKYLNFDIPYLLNSSKYYAFIRQYINSTNRNNNVSDSWLLRIDGVADATPKQLYKQTLQLMTGVVNYNKTWPFLQDLKLLNNFTYNLSFSDTSQQGTYIVQIIVNDSSGSLNDTEYAHFTICNPNFVCDGYSACNISDMQTCNSATDTNCGSTYTGNYSEFSPQSCNYCSEDIDQIRGNCHWNGTNYVQLVNWTDNNYLSCCVITGLASDCDILTYPYNITNYELICSPGTSPIENDFELTIDDSVYYGFGWGGLHSDKVSGKLYINGSNETFYCISYILTTDENLLQTNPSYTQRTSLALINREVEPREFFVTENGLASIYYTDDNLIIDGRQYVFGAECSSATQHLVSSKLVNVYYKPINEPITRFFWFNENITGFLIILFAIIFVIVIIMVLRMIYR